MRRKIPLEGYDEGEEHRDQDQNSLSKDIDPRRLVVIGAEDDGRSRARPQ
jgi:hypothetical protein